MEKEFKHNPDSEGLGYYSDGRFTIGYVDEVNGPDSIEISGFEPTRHELVQLVKYWATEELDNSFGWFLYQQTGSSETRRSAFARRRIARIADVLGGEETAEAVEQAHAEFGKGIDPQTWQIFLNGTPEEQSALQDNLQRELCGVDTVENLRVTERVLRSLGIEPLGTPQGQADRVAMLPFAAAKVSDPLRLVAPVLHYINADRLDGRYRKSSDGSTPAIEWELRYVGLTILERKGIEALVEAGQSPFDFDLTMTQPEPTWAYHFAGISTRPRWKQNAQIAEEVIKAATEMSRGFVTKIANIRGIGIITDFMVKD